MKFLRQFMLIILISFLGEMCKEFLPFPVPASVYGLMIMLVCLTTGLIQLNKVRDAAFFFIEIMPVMFIPAAVGLMDSWSAFKPFLVPISVITVSVTVLVMAVTGLVSQKIAGKRGIQNE